MNFTAVQRIKPVSTKAPNKLVQNRQTSLHVHLPAVPMVQHEHPRNWRTPADAAPPAAAATGANSASLKGGKITCLTPCGGAVRLCIAPSPGAIEGCLFYLSTSPDGDHLEKPSVVSFGAVVKVLAGELDVAEKITCLIPSPGIERCLIVPSPGIDGVLPIPSHGTMPGCFGVSSIPSHGNHLEKPSVVSFDAALQVKKSGVGMLGLNKKQQTLFTRAVTSCYIAHVTPVKRDRDWSPEASLRRKPQLPQWSAALLFVPFYGGSTCKRKLGRFSQEVPGRPTRRVTALIGLSGGGFRKLHHLEAIMATSLNVLKSEDISRTPTLGNPDSIQLHAQAHNALSMALHYLSQPNANVAGARRKAIQALSALRGLDLSLEG